MAIPGILFVAIDDASRETLLFACVGFMLGGLDDLLVDALYWGRHFVDWFRGRHRLTTIEALGDVPARSLAIFIPAWDEATIIARMLTTLLDRVDYPDYRVYVGTYPNDRATVDAVAGVAETDSRIRLVVGANPGPTTKADCLNAQWRALLADSAAGEPRPEAVVLHDAEDVVHRDELRVHSAMIGRYDQVQIPVLPLVHPQSRWVSGHYLDEFAESHANRMRVRSAIRAGLPLSGTGCAIRFSMLERIAADHGGLPFNADSLTEDYELGLTIKRLGGRACFARVAEQRGGPPIAVRAYFPASFDAAIRQKARWMTGIALAGWDRTGWSHWSDWTDHWMRMHDRRALLSMLVLASGYASLILQLIAMAIGILSSNERAVGAPPSAGLHHLLMFTTILLVWRIAMRVWFTAGDYGWREGLRAIPRLFVANMIALLATRRALASYVRTLSGEALRWDKTAHQFPTVDELST